MTPDSITSCYGLGYDESQKLQPITLLMLSLIYHQARSRALNECVSSLIKIK